MTAFADLTLEYAVVDGVKVRYAQSDPGVGGRPKIVLFSPWPESLYAFLPVWSTLSEHAHLYAVDLPGFGGSDGRTDLLSPHAMGDWIHTFITTFGLCRPHLVGPDIATSAVLYTALHHPQDIATLTVGSGGTEYPLNVTGTLQDIILAETLEPFAAMDAREIVGGALDAALVSPLPAEVRADYLASYEGSRFVESCAYVRAYPQDLEALAPVLGGISAPTLIIAGRADPFVPVANAQYLDRHLPNSRLEIFDSGHFTWEDAADDYAGALLNWAVTTKH